MFCDEAGNTGSNLSDPQQPIYVLAGWIYNEEKLSGIQAIIDRVRRPGAKEVKAARLLESGRGMKDLAGAIQDLAQVGGIPIVVVAEKKYAIAGKIVESYLDPAHNQLIGGDWTWDSDLMQDAAEMCFQLPDPLLSEFAAAYRNNDGLGLEAVLLKLVAVLSGPKESPLSVLMLGSKGRMTEVAEEGTKASRLRRGVNSLNFPVFWSLLHMVESIGRAYGADSISILHDETREFCDAFQMAFEAVKNGAGGGVILPNDGVIHGRLEVVSKLEYSTSHETPGIQAAEMLAGGVRKITECLQRRTQVAEELMPVVAITFPAVLLPPPKLVSIIGSEIFCAEWMKTLGRLAKSDRPDAS